jgi:hypothetical protein
MRRRATRTEGESRNFAQPVIWNDPRVQSQTHFLRHHPCRSQSTAGLHDSTRTGGGETSTGTDHLRMGSPQLGRISTELPHMGCIAPLISSQKHWAWLASGKANVRAAVVSTWRISRVEYMLNPATATSCNRAPGGQRRLSRRAHGKSLGRSGCSAWARRTRRGAAIELSRPPLPILRLSEPGSKARAQGHCEHPGRPR